MQLQRHDLQAQAERGIHALQREDFAIARDAFGLVVKSPDASAQAWLLYAQACEGCADWDDALLALDHVLGADRENPFALLMKGRIYGFKQDDRASVSFYRRGIRRCSQLGSLPGDLPLRLEQAQAEVAKAEQRFEEKLRVHLARKAISAFPPRFAEALRIASGRQQIYLQQPTSFYYPGLPQRAWYEADEFPWMAQFEAAVPQMRAEIEQILSDSSRTEPYVQESADRASRGHSLLNDSRWSAFHLWKDGAEVPENTARCPVITRTLGLAPMPRIQSRSPMALISILEPGTHIPPHTGMLNTRLICHVPLVAPSGCRLRVGGETRDVREAEAMIFDDSIEHEAWNDGTGRRAVLLFEIWRPEISEEERLALTAMFEAVSGYESRSPD